MENESNIMPEGDKKQPKLPRKTLVLIILAAVLALILIALLVLIPILHNNRDAEQTTTEPSTNESQPPESLETTESIPEETEPQMLDWMAELYAQNPDIAGWLRIDDTKIDYPVMYTPDDEEKYFRADFEGNYHWSGLPFIDKDCQIDPESGNLIMYAHNMGNGTAFGSLTKYENEEYWKEHPIIYYSTLYEERTYEIVAAFYDRVYYQYEDVFKFYQFVDAGDEADYDAAVAAYKEKAEYDTGVYPEYGDKLITLVTCAYQTYEGRFVVVAREIPEDELDQRLALYDSFKAESES